MKRLYVLAVAAVGMLLSGCGSFVTGGFSIGGPTINVGVRNFSRVPDTTQGTETIKYDLVFSLLPGSPAGSIAFVDASGSKTDEFTFNFNTACPPSEVNPCEQPPISFSKTYPINAVNSFVAVAYETYGFANKQGKRVELNSPLSLY